MSHQLMGIIKIKYKYLTFLMNGIKFLLLKIKGTLGNILIESHFYFISYNSTNSVILEILSLQ